MTIGEENEPMVHYYYSISEPFKTTEGKRSVKWNDPDLAIPWPMQPSVISTQDATGNKSLRELFPERFQ